jgi:hypothetical protein
MANFTGQPISSSYQRVLQIDSNIIQDGLGNTVNATINSLTGSFSGSLTGIATSSSYALTASYVPAVPEDLGSSLGVNLATAAVLSNTPLYNNGTLGVGATLSASVAGALVVDGITSGIGDRILVKNQTSQLQNGVYEVTVAGATGVRYILTRTTDADETEEFDPQIVIPSQGNTNRGKIFGQTTNLPTIGTSPIVYTEINSNQFVSQVTTGTQNLYNIPWWTASTRQLSRGINRFQFDSVNNRLRITGSLTVSGSITGSAGVVNSLTASYSVTSSYTLNAESASYVSTASYVENAQTASYVLNAVSASYILSSSYSVTSSYALTANLALSSSKLFAVQADNNLNYNLLGSTSTSTNYKSIFNPVGITFNPTSSLLTVANISSSFITASAFETNVQGLGTTFKTTSSGSIILPITSSNTPGYTGQQGEMFFGSDGSGNYVIWAYLGGAWRSGSLF